jgi:SAP domain-containing ribonucleoprotein
MGDYLQLKVPDLKKLLVERRLVVTGNKADLIARLQENDKKSGGGASKSSQMMLRQILIGRGC